MTNRIREERRKLLKERSEANLSELARGAEEGGLKCVVCDHPASEHSDDSCQACGINCAKTVAVKKALVKERSLPRRAGSRVITRKCPECKGDILASPIERISACADHGSASGR